MLEIKHPLLSSDEDKYAPINELNTEFEMESDLEKEKDDLITAGFKPEDVSFCESIRDCRQRSLSPMLLLGRKGPRGLRQFTAKIRFIEKVGMLSRKAKHLRDRSVANSRVARMYVENLIPLDTLKILSYTDRKPVLKEEVTLLRDRESNPN